MGKTQSVSRTPTPKRVPAPPAKPSSARKRSDPKRLADEMNAIIKDQDKRRAAAQARKETDTYAPVSPPARPPQRRRRPERRISSQGIAGFRKAPTDA